MQLHFALDHKMNVVAAAAMQPPMEAHAAKPKRHETSSSVKGSTKARRNERNILTFYEKIAVIRYYDETNISRNSLAKMFHCCATQIRRILEKKRELLQQLATLSEADASIIIEEMTRKRRKFEMSAISFLLHEWVERCRQLRLSGSIRNQTLKETALKMAAMLKLPAFRPSYRWLNRFRSKYKYEDEELGYVGHNAVHEQLPVEHIIVEFKNALPNFMQKEVTDMDVCIKKQASLTDLVNLSSENSENSYGEQVMGQLADDDVDDDDVDDEDENVEDNDVVEVTCEPNVLPSLSLATPEELTQLNEQEPNPDQIMNAGTCTLLSSVFPHLAIIHQFALMNSDVQALELISQLGVHMQQQATSGAYRTLSLATNSETLEAMHQQLPAGSIFADIDDIELIE